MNSTFSNIFKGLGSTPDDFDDIEFICIMPDLAQQSDPTEVQRKVNEDMSKLKSEEETFEIMLPGAIEDEQPLINDERDFFDMDFSEAIFPDSLPPRTFNLNPGYNNRRVSFKKRVQRFMRRATAGRRRLSYAVDSAVIKAGDKMSEKTENAKDEVRKGASKLKSVDSNKLLSALEDVLQQCKRTVQLRTSSQ